MRVEKLFPGSGLKTDAVRLKSNYYLVLFPAKGLWAGKTKIERFSVFNALEINWRTYTHQ